MNQVDIDKLIKNRLVVASVSGGKDSTAVSLHLRELGIQHERVFFDTGWEHPDLYTHLDYLDDKLGPIQRIQPKMPKIPDEVLPRVLEIEALVGRSPSAFVRQVVSKSFFPSGQARFCTQNLKIYPFIAWAEQQDAEILSVVGIRADESRDRSQMTEFEAMSGADFVEVWRPLLRWTVDDVIAIHQRHNVKPCPLYLRGSTRVGCWPCFQAGKKGLQELAKDKRRIEAIRLLEALVGDAAESRGSSRPTMFRADKVVNGPSGPERPGVPIDAALRWARTTRGGSQFMLDTSWGQEPGCVRWGMCERLEVG